MEHKIKIEIDRKRDIRISIIVQRYGETKQDWRGKKSLWVMESQQWNVSGLANIAEGPAPMGLSPVMGMIVLSSHRAQWPWTIQGTTGPDQSNNPKARSDSVI